MGWALLHVLGGQIIYGLLFAPTPISLACLSRASHKVPSLPRGTGVPKEVEPLQTRNTFTTGFGVAAEQAVLFLNEVPTENDVLPLLCIFPANPAKGKPSSILPQSSPSQGLPPTPFLGLTEAALDAQQDQHLK